MEKQFDAHCHHLFDMTLEEAVSVFEEEFRATGTARETFLALPCDVNEDGAFTFSDMQNIRMLFLKHAFSPTAYAYAGLEHPINVRECSDEYLSELYLTQVREYMASGFDGVKMFEGYPSMRKTMGRPLYHEVYDKFYSYLEDNAIPVTMHLANPETFWDASKIDAYSKAKGRYCDETYPTKAQLHSELERVMQKHPRLRIAIAHFGFMAYDIKMAEAWLENYPNTVIDITPGGEQLLMISAAWNMWRPFFEKYQDRIIYGSDAYAFPRGESFVTCYQRRPEFMRRLFETDGEYDYVNRPFRGIMLDKSIRQKIYYDNAVRLFGEPKKINYGYLLKKAEELLATKGNGDKNREFDLQYIIQSCKDL